jgi:hypothetical protein
MLEKSAVVSVFEKLRMPLAIALKSWRKFCQRGLVTLEKGASVE